MKKIDNRQYKLTQIRPKPAAGKPGMKGRRGRRYDSKLDRRGTK